MMTLTEFRFDEVGKVVVSGNFEGYDFSMPVNYAQALVLLEQIKTSGENALNQVANHKRQSKKTKDAQEKADKPLEGPSSGGDASRVAATSQLQEDPDLDKHSSSEPPPLPPFREPATPVAYTRKRMNKKELALFTRFEKCMPKVPTGKRRSGETMKKLDVARSYILAEQESKILDWIKFLKNGGGLALVSNG